MGEIMKRKLTKLIAMLLVTATLFSINVSMTITASAVESAIGDINQDGAVTIEFDEENTMTAEKKEIAWVKLDDFSF